MRLSIPIRLFIPLAASLALLLVCAGAASASLGDRTLRQGMEGSDVMELQREVTYLGYPTPGTGPSRGARRATWSTTSARPA